MKWNNIKRGISRVEMMNMVMIRSECCDPYCFLTPDHIAMIAATTVIKMIPVFQILVELGRWG